MKDDLFIETDISHTCPHNVAQVWGLSLMPLSLWHLWFLRSQENPFIVGGNPYPSDFALAVLTCSLTRRGLGETINDDVQMAELVSGMVEKWLDMPDEKKSEHLKAFDHYIEEGAKAPEFWENGESDPIKDRLRCPPEWHLVMMLLKNKICQTEEEAWNYSYARAVCWRAVIGEQNGGRDYIDR